LRHFISQLGQKSLPLYRLLKKHGPFFWTVEAYDALVKLKATLAHVPILMPPQDVKPLHLYIMATTQVVSAVIVVERAEEGHTLLVKGQYTTSARCCMRLERYTPRSRSCSTQWCSRGASYDIL
jgi:hypothetical protein